MMRRSIASLLKTVFCVQVFVFLLAFPLTLLSRELHTFINADTLSNLKVSTRVDIKSMKKLVRAISQHTKIASSNLILAQNDLIRKNMVNSIKSRKIAPDDIILFYYTGHGFRTALSDTVWPNIFFPRTKEHLDMNELIKVLLSKKASLYIVLADCCNDLKQVPASEPRYLASKRVPTTTQLKHTYKSLFDKQNLLIVASGSTPGNLSWATEEGGVFTNALIKSLDAETAQSDPCWDRIFQRAARYCKKYQRPQYSITELNPAVSEMGIR